MRNLLFLNFLLAAAITAGLAVAAGRIAGYAQAGTRRIAILINIFNAGIQLRRVIGIFIKLVMINLGRGFLVAEIIAFGYPVIIAGAGAFKIHAGAV